MISPTKALDMILSKVSLKDSEIIHFTESYGRVLSEDIKAQQNIPPFNNSAMDGYGVKFQDTYGASKHNPAVLTVVDEIPAGASSSRELKKGEAIRIMTGAPVPQGVDAVVPFEDTVEKGDKVQIFTEFKINANIRMAGEDISQGMTVLKRGRRLGSADAGLLASLNSREILTARMPLVAIVSTGDEIVEPGEETSKGQIRNSNAYTLMSEIRRFNGIPNYLGIVRDDKNSAAEVFKKALESDIVITTGGVSMGRYDYVKDIMRDLGVEILFEAVKIKPGKPLAFGIKGRTLFFGLPGNPVSTMVSFNLFVRPALLKMMGATDLEQPVVSAVLDNDLVKKAGRVNFLRGYFHILDGEIHVNTTGPQGSGILRSMSIANCLIDIPSEVTEVKKGEKVSIIMLNHGELRHV